MRILQRLALNWNKGIFQENLNRVCRDLLPLYCIVMADNKNVIYNGLKNDEVHTISLGTLRSRTGARTTADRKLFSHKNHAH